MPESMPEARWDLPDDPSLEWLKRRARNLRRRAEAGDPAAVELVATYDPGDAAMSLARAQRVVARAYGFAGWSRLREHLATRVELTREMAATSPDDDRVDAFLRAAVLSYSEPSAVETAAAMLSDDPDLVAESLWTMAACGRSDLLAAALADDASLVRAEGGPHRWVPLLYLCYSRLPQQDAVGSLRTLLDHGADPNAGCLWHGLPSPFTALTGVLGGGEREEPPHPQSVELATMLLEAGADPNDNQAFYNRMFEPDDSHLGPLLRFGAGRDHPSPWRERLGSAYPSPEEMVGEHLRSAAEKGYVDRVRTLLAAGVDPNTTGYHPILGDQNAYEVAVRHGQRAAAALLVEAGATSDRLDADDLALDRAFAGEPGDAPPGLAARRPDAMRLAAELHGVAALAALLDLGYDVSAIGWGGTTALHEAALRGDRPMVEWLLAHGADVSIRDRRFDSTPAGWAEHAGHHDLAELLEPH